MEFPEDGYLQVFSNGGNITCNIYGANATNISDFPYVTIMASKGTYANENAVYVRKGMKCTVYNEDTDNAYAQYNSLT
jgi:hypothetical protein